MVAADVEDVSGFDHGPDLGLLQVRDLVVVGRGKVCAHCAVVTCDNNAAFSGGGGAVDHVFDVETWRERNQGSVSFASGIEIGLSSVIARP